MSEEKNILEETASTVAEKVRKTRRNYHKKENYKQEEGTKTKRNYKTRTPKIMQEVKDGEVVETSIAKEVFKKSSLKIIPLGGLHEIGKNITVFEYEDEMIVVEMIYHHFKSAGSQILTRKNFLPIDITEELKRDRSRDLNSTVTSKEAQEYLKKKASVQEQKQEENVRPLNDNFIVEPDMNTVLSQLIPKYLHLMLYTALLDSIASEHAARMVAMQTATDNADEILRELNLQYNKSRQQAITNELLDIVGGSINN